MTVLTTDMRSMLASYSLWIKIEDQNAIILHPWYLGSLSVFVTLFLELMLCIYAQYYENDKVLQGVAS